MVLVLTAAPSGLRGDLTKWLLEISPGIFVGKVNRRIREKLWERTTVLCTTGRALMVYSTTGEQGLGFQVHGHDWVPTDLDGVTVLRRPTAHKPSTRRQPWSNARAQQASRRPAWKRRFDEDEQNETTDPDGTELL
ncbi:hypothetical protein GCM10027417_20740 [Glutamicibacter endophyticus]|uniref:type I-E CRISPR-associated endoribonuclease Cas2e n=1 Tax=Glutamicibacter sp. PS TaxID=3075634 RepID=UPI002852C37F|nr:type I-E CRISPR-associated endoribonuclease Cas2e [Glutamicibacter sp. PS]